MGRQYVPSRISKIAHVMLVIFFLMLISVIWHVHLNKWACRPDEFKGKGPHFWVKGTFLSIEDV